jgi:hypothetical protein
MMERPHNRLDKKTSNGNDNRNAEENPNKRRSPKKATNPPKNKRTIINHQKNTETNLRTTKAHIITKVKKIRKDKPKAPKMDSSHVNGADMAS